MADKKPEGAKPPVKKVEPVKEEKLETQPEDTSGKTEEKTEEEDEKIKE